MSKIDLAGTGGGSGNVNAGGTLTNHALVVGQGTTAIATIAPLNNGQLAIGSTGVDPVPATLTAGANVTITNAAGSITIASTGGGTPGGAFNSIEYNNSGAFGGIGPLTNGQLVIGSTGLAPVAATITAGANITVTNAAGSITIASTGGGGGMVINSSTITGSTANEVMYGDGTLLQQAAHFQIISDQPKVDLGFSYLYDDGFGGTVNVLFGDPANNTWYGGNAGNFTSATAFAITGFGDGALANLTAAASENTAFGAFALASCTSGNGNVAVGDICLTTLTTQGGNTAVGSQALRYNTSAGNTAVGQSALTLCSSSSNSNVAIGNAALNNITSGASQNVAIGASSMNNATGGSQNLAVGNSSLSSNTTGVANIAFGFAALNQNTTGTANSASGSSCLGNNTTGSNNSGEGANSFQQHYRQRQSCGWRMPP